MPLSSRYVHLGARFESECNFEFSLVCTYIVGIYYVNAYLVVYCTLLHPRKGKKDSHLGFMEYYHHKWCGTWQAACHVEQFMLPSLMESVVYATVLLVVIL